jgi:hypothetical protein
MNNIKKDIRVGSGYMKVSAVAEGYVQWKAWY